MAAGESSNIDCWGQVLLIARSATIMCFMYGSLTVLGALSCFVIHLDEARKIITAIEGKKMFTMLIAAVVALFAGYNVYQSQNTVVLSELVLANVEALASD